MSVKIGHLDILQPPPIENPSGISFVAKYLGDKSFQDKIARNISYLTSTGDLRHNFYFSHSFKHEGGEIWQVYCAKYRWHVEGLMDSMRQYFGYGSVGIINYRGYDEYEIVLGPLKQKEVHTDNATLWSAAVINAERALLSTAMLSFSRG